LDIDDVLLNGKTALLLHLNARSWVTTCNAATTADLVPRGLSCTLPDQPQ